MKLSGYGNRMPHHLLVLSVDWIYIQKPVIGLGTARQGLCQQLFGDGAVREGDWASSCREMCYLTRKFHF